jgi:murein L,D-transpeptidase YcbB/YkuD
MMRISMAERRGMVTFLLVIVLLQGCTHPAKESAPVPVPPSKKTAPVPAPAPDPRPIIEDVLSARPGSEIIIEGEAIYSAVLVRSFYEARNYQPAWSRNGRLEQASTLMEAIEGSYVDGLTPGYYHLERLRSLVASAGQERPPSAIQLAHIDLLLSDAFITLGCHLSGGCVDPVAMKAEWFAGRRKVDVASLLEEALRKKRVRETLQRLHPVQAAYDNLKQALAKYREMSLRGAWPQVTAGPLLKRGAQSERVVELRKRLEASGDLVPAGSSAGLFDERLETAVLEFQRRHGLKPDGIVGPATVAAVNVPLEDRVRQIEVNLERLRWILGNTEQRFIIVNIADFRLDAIENGKSVLSMKVVVGKPFLKTPVFTAKMTYLIINPVWNVPDSIARKEILKDIKKDPLYLAKEDMKVLRGWGSREEEIDPGAVDWSHITPSFLPYRFRQEPGARNPLGRIKFMFPNQFDVYLHDTPAKGLFSQDVRTFSHGCTRIEKPLELAEYLLKDSPDWSREKILAAIEDGKELEVRIPRPLNVHFIYLTAWVDGNDTLQFRNDVYGRDRVLSEALGEKPVYQ